MRRTAAALGVGVWFAARAAFAGEPAAAQAAKASAVPRDGAVAFSYSRVDGVTGCSQQDEAAVRFLLAGVMRVEPFVPAGKSAPLTLVVRVTRAQDGVIRAALEMQDAAGASKGSTFEEDATCDGAHMKLAVSIALLLQPQPAGTATAATATATAATATAATATATAATATAATGVSTAPAIVQPVCKIPLGGYCLGVDIYSLAFSAGGALSLGFTADPGGGAWVNAEIRPIEAFSVGLEFRGIFPSRVVASEPVDPDKPYGTPKEPDVSGATFMLVPCVRYWWLMGCAVGHFGFSMAQTPVELVGWPVVGAGPRLGIEIPFAKRFFARLQGDVLFNFTESYLEITNQNLIWRQSLASGFVGAGLGVTLR